MFWPQRSWPVTNVQGIKNCLVHTVCNALLPITPHIRKILQSNLCRWRLHGQNALHSVVSTLVQNFSIVRELSTSTVSLSQALLLHCCRGNGMLTSYAVTPHFLVMCPQRRHCHLVHITTHSHLPWMQGQCAVGHPSCDSYLLPMYAQLTLHSTVIRTVIHIYHETMCTVYT